MACKGEKVGPGISIYAKPRILDVYCLSGVWVVGDRTLIYKPSEGPWMLLIPGFWNPQEELVLVLPHELRPSTSFAMVFLRAS